jgi:hypothetical protein
VLGCLARLFVFAGARRRSVGMTEVDLVDGNCLRERNCTRVYVCAGHVQMRIGTGPSAKATITR